MDRARFLDALCAHARGLQLLLVVSVVCSLVLVVALGAVEAGSATYVVAVVQLVSFAAVGLLSAASLVACVRYT